jgi:hypothetical protein
MCFHWPSFGYLALGIFAVSLATSACGSDNQGQGACQRICQFQAECYSVCDYPGEPDCDPEALYLEEYSRCLEACDGALTTRGAECQAAAGTQAKCLEQSSCGDTQTGDCASAEMRYHELCFNQPGDWVCVRFCEELEAGCLPWERFGFRGADCEATCKTGALAPECREAHYAFDACTEGLGYACRLLDESCAASAAALDEACPTWASAPEVPAENAACTPVGERQCTCGLYLAEEDCPALAANRCRFEYGKGLACVEAIQALDLCMAGIPECDRELLREGCLPQWDGWYEACSP